MVTLAGRDVYLGKFGTRQSRAEYDRLIGEWLAADRCYTRVASDLTVAELAHRYWQYAKTYYRKDGGPTGTLPVIRVALRNLRQNYGHTFVNDFGLLALEALQTTLVAHGLSRNTVNSEIACIRRAFRWGTAKQLVPSPVFQALQALPGLRKGRTLARESKPVQPVAEEVVEATLPHLAEAVADMVRFQRLTGCRPGEVCSIRPCDVDTTAEVWIYRPEWPQIPRIEGIVEMPVLRADGTVLQTPGYDKTTGLFFAPRAAYPHISDHPSIGDAKRALDELLEVVRDFPFGNEAHRAARLAGLLTPPARFAFEGPSPVFVIEGNRPGVGKGKLADTIGAILTGQQMSSTTMPSKDEEMRKRITSIALAGEPMVLLDNVVGSLGSPSLDSAWTKTFWEDRILGRSEEVRLPLYAVWYVTANNVTIRPDTLRRTCHVRLEWMEEHPEMRKGFHHPNLEEWIQREHPRLAAAAVTILAAFCAAGRPQADVLSWGSYEGWNALVRQAVIWVSGTDPADTRLALIENRDEDASLLRRLIAGWLEIDPHREGVTIADALRSLADTEDMAHQSGGPAKYQALRDALDEIAPPTGKKAKGSRAAAIGYYLRKNRRVCVDGQYIDRLGETEDHSALWGVQKAQDVAG